MGSLVKEAGEVGRTCVELVCRHCSSRSSSDDFNACSTMHESHHRLSGQHLVRKRAHACSPGPQPPL